MMGIHHMPVWGTLGKPHLWSVPNLQQFCCHLEIFQLGSSLQIQNREIHLEKK